MGDGSYPYGSPVHRAARASDRRVRSPCARTLEHPALLASALLFGVWHLPWALKSFLDEENAEPIASLLIANFLPQALLGIVWGYLYLRTGNLWGSWAAHTLTNSALNFLHVQSAEGTDAALPTRMITFTLVMLLGLLAIWWLSRTWNLPSVAPWGTGVNA